MLISWGCSSVSVEHLSVEQVVAGSSPVTPVQHRLNLEKTQINNSISQCNLMVKSPAHNWVDAGSNPAAATNKCGDSVMANMTVSKTVDLSSNLSPLANLVP